MLAVAIPCFRLYQHLDHAISSVLEHGAGKVSRIILGLNGDDDDARQKARRLLSAERSEVSLNFLFSSPTIPATNNFFFAPFVATEPYFALLGADDFWSAGQVGPIVDWLERKAPVVGVAPKVLLRQGAAEKPATSNAKVLNAPGLEDRLALYFDHPGDNSYFFGIFRTAAIRDCVRSPLSATVGAELHALDWLILARLLHHGPVEYSQALTVTRDETPWQSYSLGVMNNADLPDLLRDFPVIEMSVHYVLETRLPISSPVIQQLIMLNLKKHFEVLQLRGFSVIAANQRIPAAQERLLAIFNAAIVERESSDQHLWTRPAGVAKILGLA
jgi:hypothetical protein